MPYVLKANQEAIAIRIARVARYMDLEESSFDGFMAWVLNLREQVGIPHALRDIGIDLQQQGLVGRMALEDPTAATNPIMFTADQYAELFARAVEGNL